MISLTHLAIVGDVRTIVTAILVAAIITPARAGAQQAAPLLVIASPSRSDLERAARLETQAERAEQFVKGARDAARLHVRAARLRGQTAEAVTCYRRAAWLFSASGDQNSGRRMLEEAAKVMLSRGEAAPAIGVLIDAALMAAADGDLRQVNRLVQRTRSLLDSAQIPDDTRMALRTRVEEAARLASQ
jgi:hypothetical protein